MSEVRIVSSGSPVVMPILEVLLLLFTIIVWIDAAGGEGEVGPVHVTDANHTLFWRPGGEGIFSLILQLKALHYAAERCGIRRHIVIADSSSFHYSGKVRLCDLLVLPHNISCGGVASMAHCNIDINTLIRDTSVCYSGDPKWGNISIHQYFDSKREFAVNTPRLRFQPKYLEIATKVRTLLGIPPGKSYDMVHWRRGDQLTTRCVRVTGLVDRSLNCANVTTFAEYLHRLVAAKSTTTILLTTNEDNPAALEMIRATGVRLVPQNISSIVEVDSNNSPTPDAQREQMASEADGAIMDMVVDAILMLEATHFHAFGGSFIHDAIEAERMLRNQSFCLEKQSPGSFCQSLTAPNYTSVALPLLAAFHKERTKHHRHHISIRPPSSKNSRKDDRLHVR